MRALANYSGYLAFKVLALLLLVSCGKKVDLKGAFTPENEVSYNFDVRPILSDKCFACHGPDEKKREAGLRLDLEAEAFKALKDHPDRHAIVPGKPEQSAVYLRLIAGDEDEIMPPKSSNLSMTEQEIAIIRKWIDQGAKFERHWAFARPRKRSLPEVENEDWPVNEIDHFTLAKMEAAGLEPNEPSDSEKLLKRLSLDLTGLLPDLATMNRFPDLSGAAYDQLVARLLAQPAYGEKMAVGWLDIARYADSYGYQMDNFRTQWPWRDWVIHAFNRNLPYDRFVTWQLAGDLLPGADKEQILATAFNRNHKITEEGAVDEEEYRTAYVADRTDTFGKAFLAMTVECARCHDHKYDPISQKEYYQLFSFFNQVDELRPVYTAIDPTVGTPAAYAKKPILAVEKQDLAGVLSFIHKTDTNRLIVSVMGDLDTLRKTHVLLRGEFNQYGDRVENGTPAQILRFGKQYERNRLGLAHWLTDPENPLTARVFVNRVWQEFFGKGLVKTAGDFGMQGELPTHPELLDWLAADFIENGWNVKRLVTQIVSSATYRQSSNLTKAKSAADPENKLLSRAPRLRVPAEFVRDILLGSSGLLQREIGGPSVKPYQPPGLWEAATAGGDLLLSKYRQDSGAALYRRGIYSFVKRTVPPPAMAIFDASNRDQCEVSRLTTSTPLQALVMMNDPTMLESARVLAQKLSDDGSPPEKTITLAFRTILCRKPKPRELELLAAYYKESLAALNPRKAAELLSVGEYPAYSGTKPVPTAALMQVIAMLYNLEETLVKS